MTDLIPRDRITFYLSPDLALKFRNLAKKDRRGLSSMMDKILDEYFSDPSSHPSSPDFGD